MPLIVISGIPCSGKSTVCNTLETYFKSKNIAVVVISETEIIKSKNLNRNAVYKDSKIEKEIRGIIKSDYLRNISPNCIVILDGLNYIKGFRYELYCASKASKTTQCTIHCDPGRETAWNHNIERPEEEQYNRDIFDGLIQRYEAPESRNRWDSPLFFIFDSKDISLNEIELALLGRKPPPPNQSTESAPLAGSNFLHDLDKSVQEVVSKILEAKKMGLEGSISVPGSEEDYVMKRNTNVNLIELNRLKRQFISYIKGHYDFQDKDIKTLFVQYLNTAGS